MGLYEARPCEHCGQLIYPAVPRSRRWSHGLHSFNADDGQMHYCELPEPEPWWMEEEKKWPVLRPQPAPAPEAESPSTYDGRWQQ